MFTGTFLKGVTYALTLRVRGGAIGPAVTATLGNNDDFVTQYVWTSASPVFTTKTISWTPTADRTGVSLTLRIVTNPAAVTPFYVDTLVLSAPQPTLVDRRGFRRSHSLPVKTALTTALGEQIGDVWARRAQDHPVEGDRQDHR